MKIYLNKTIWLVGIVCMPVLLMAHAHALSWEQSSDVNTIIIVNPGSETGNTGVNGRLPDAYFHSGERMHFDRKTLRATEYEHHAKDDSQVPVVPEPETYALMLAGLGLLVIALRRNRDDAFRE